MWAPWRASSKLSGRRAHLVPRLDASLLGRGALDGRQHHHAPAGGVAGNQHAHALQLAVIANAELLVVPAVA